MGRLCLFGLWLILAVRLFALGMPSVARPALMSVSGWLPEVHVPVRDVVRLP